MAKGFFSWFNRGSKDKAAPQETQPEESLKVTPEAEQPAQPDIESVPVTELQAEMREQVVPVVAETVSEPVATIHEVADIQSPEATEPEVAETPEALEAPEIQEVDAVAEELLISEFAVAEQQEETQEKPKRAGLFSRLVKGLMRTRESIGAGFMALFRGKKLDDDLFDELETQLLTADLGVETTQRIMQSLTKQAKLHQLKDAEALYDLLKQEMAAILQPVSQPLQIDSSKTPYVILMVGVNGVGKTTTIGKLAKLFQAQGKSVMLAAGDTFRAAAVEQLQVWGQRNHIPVIAQHTGADSASVIFDAIQAAKSRGVDILIADTAGRLQNKNHLMEELKKIVRVMKKHDESAPHEVMLTLDASTGQNAISQAKLFGEAVGVNGITLTKLDGTAKGGVIFAIANQFNIPIRYIGVGEAIEDLRQFEANDFIEALFSGEQH